MLLSAVTTEGETMARYLIWIAMICGLAATSCSREPVPEPAADASVGPPTVAETSSTEVKIDPTVAAFDCADGTYVVAEFRGIQDDVVVFLPGKTVFLPQVEAASGAKYSDGDVVFWSKGHEAVLEWNGATTHCVKNGPASVIEKAKLGGADFWATGNEPGWTLELFSDHLVLVTNYGELRIEVPVGEPIEDPMARTTVFSATSEEHEVVVTLRGDSCADDMSGQPFPTTVELLLDGRTYRGCGQPLH